MQTDTTLFPSDHFSYVCPKKIIATKMWQTATVISRDKASYYEKFDRVSLARMTLVIRECRTKEARMKFDRDRY